MDNTDSKEEEEHSQEVVIALHDGKGHQHGPKRAWLNQGSLALAPTPAAASSLRFMNKSRIIMV